MSSSQVSQSILAIHPRNLLVSGPGSMSAHKQQPCRCLQQHGHLPLSGHSKAWNMSACMTARAQQMMECCCCTVSNIQAVGSSQSLLQSCHPASAICSNHACLGPMMTAALCLLDSDLWCIMTLGCLNSIPAAMLCACSQPARLHHRMQSLIATRLLMLQQTCILRIQPRVCHGISAHL